jgi:hypothetical protein
MVDYKNVLKTLQKSYSYIDKILILKNNGKIEYSTDNWNVKEDIKGFLSSWVSGNAQFVIMDGVKYSILQMEPERFVGTNRQKKGHLIGAATAERDKYLIAHIDNKAKGWMHNAYPTIARAAVALNDTSKLRHLDASKQGVKGGKKAQKKKKKVLKKIKKLEKKFDKKLKKEKKEKAIEYAKEIIEMANSIGKKDIADKYQDKRDELLGKKKEKTEEMSEQKPQKGLLQALGAEQSTQSRAEATPTPKVNPIIMEEVKNFLRWIKDREGLAKFVSYYLQQNDQQKISVLSDIYKELYRITSE